MVHGLSQEFVPSAWGRGYATEAVGAVLGWIWSNHDHQSVIAVTQSANLGSRRLLDRLGFRFEHEFDEWGALQSQYRLGRPGDPS